jgi:hypothetical protein
VSHVVKEEDGRGVYEMMTQEEKDTIRWTGREGEKEVVVVD